MAAKAKLSKRFVDAAKAPASGEERLWDTELTGFCLRTYATGRKVFAIKYRVGTRQRWANIGEYGKPWTGFSGNTSDALTPEEARSEARFISGSAVGGTDATVKVVRRDVDVTVTQLIARYLKEGPATKPAKRASSWASDASNLNSHVKPLIGDRRVIDLTRSDIARMTQQITAGETTSEPTKTKKRGRSVVRGGSGAAARSLSATSALFSWGIEHDVGTSNPAKGVKLARRAVTERFLTGEEAAELLRHLDALEAAREINASHADILRLLLFTGARKTEITDLKWTEVDMARTRLTLPPERTKAGGATGERRIALNVAAVAVLEKQKRKDGSPFVFPAYRGEGAVVGMQKTWAKARKAAGLEDVRIHDLRHSFASFAVADGASLLLIAKALGHANSRTTERYAHLAEDPVQAMAEAAGKRMTSSGVKE